MTLIERLKDTEDALFRRGMHTDRRRVDEAIVMLAEQDRLLEEGKAIVLGLAAERTQLRAEVESLRAVAVKLQTYIWTEDSQSRRYDAEAVVAVNKKASLLRGDTL